MCASVTKKTPPRQPARHTSERWWRELSERGAWRLENVRKRFEMRLGFEDPILLHRGFEFFDARERPVFDRHLEAVIRTLAGKPRLEGRDVLHDVVEVIGNAFEVLLLARH